MTRLRFLVRQLAYDADRSLLVRPSAILVSLGALAVVLPAAEARWSPIRALALRVLWAVPSEPSAAQLVLSTVAGSVMTVISIVYSVLVVALSLASVQFSPRILARFMRDRTSQRVLGLFIGTFTYCLLVLRATRSAPDPFVPALAVFGALALAIACLASLLFFVHHMAQAIQANYIVDTIAAETEGVIDAVSPQARSSSSKAPPARPPERAENVVRAHDSGYVQIVALDQLADVARSLGATLHMTRGMGQFIPEHGVFIVADKPLDEAAREACREALDLGPVRTMQDDMEFGIRQIVDIALKAISPAVNDPSTAVTCVDHLSRLLGRIARRGDPEPVVRDEQSGRPLVVLPATGFARALDLALNQIRQYGKSDVAVLLRITRALSDVAGMTARPEHVAALRRHAMMLRSVVEAIPPDDRAELNQRVDALMNRLEEAREASNASDAAEASG